MKSLYRFCPCALGGFCLSKKSIDGSILWLICIHYPVIIFICVACSEEVICNETNYPRENSPDPKKRCSLHFYLGLGVCEVKLIHDNSPVSACSSKHLSRKTPVASCPESHCLLLSALSYFSTEIEIVNKQKDKVECNRA